MTTKVSGTHAAAVAESQGEEGGEYNLHYNDKSTGQEWILDAYRSLEPGVRFKYDVLKFRFCILMFVYNNMEKLIYSLSISVIPSSL